VVNSGIRLVERARRRRLPVVIINRGATRADQRATVKIESGTSEVLRAFADALPGARRRSS
jgi:NAD-dependent SIR2 family protein deacetylase